MYSTLAAASGGRAGSGAARRSSSQKVLPTPGSLCTPMLPPIACIRRWLSARPMPLPSMPRPAASRRSKGRNRRSICSRSMPWPVVAHLDAQRPGPALAGDLDLALRAVELDRVAQQVQQHLPQAQAVGQRAVAAFCIDGHRLQRDGMRLRQRQQQAAAFLDQRNQRQRHVVDLQATGLDVAEVQRLVDQHQQMVGAAEDGRAPAPAGRGPAAAGCRWPATARSRRWRSSVCAARVTSATGTRTWPGWRAQPRRARRSAPPRPACAR